jgi:hypothetical protein
MYKPLTDQKAPLQPLVARANEGKDPTPSLPPGEQTLLSSSQDIRVENANTSRDETSQAPADRAGTQLSEECPINGFDSNTCGKASSSQDKTQNIAVVSECGR